MGKILIIDNHTAARRGLRSMVDELGYSTVNDATSISEAINAIGDPWTMAIIDLCLSDGCCLDWVDMVRGMNDLRPILVHTDINDTDIAKRAFVARVNGYSYKSSSDADILNAIKTVNDGQYFVEPELAVLLAKSSAEVKESPLHHKLTEREFRVMCLVAQGAKASCIAEALNISKNTISGYRSRILKKLDLHSTSELTRYVIRHQLS